MKAFARAEVHAPDVAPTRTARSRAPSVKVLSERIFLCHLDAFDRNCSRYITPRLTEEDVVDRRAMLRDRIAELEAALPQQVNVAN